MVNSKKMSKSSIAVIVLSILLVLSLILGFTGAWFTDKKDGEEIKKNFGTVELNVTATDFGKVTRGESALGETDKIMPGDVISYELTVTKAETSEDFWYAVVINVSGTGEDKTASLDNLTETDVKDAYGKVGGTITLTGADYGNTYQGKPVTLSYTVVAVQKANVTKTEAVDLLKAAVSRETV